MKKLLLFDVDLTLVDWAGAGMRAFFRAISQVFLKGGEIERFKPDGKSDHLIFSEILAHFQIKPADFQKAFQLQIKGYLKFLKEEIGRVQKRPVPGIAAILDELASPKGVFLGLATGNVEPGARLKLAPLDLNRFFPTGGFSVDLGPRVEIIQQAVQNCERYYQERFSPADIWVIGDTDRDVEAGKLAGVRTVGVATGRFSKEALEAYGPDLTISDFQQDRAIFWQRVLPMEEW